LPRVEVYLETDRLLLRRLTDADAENLFLLDSDPAVMRFKRRRACSSAGTACQRRDVRWRRPG
jgi:RimJ/RimL family protein N-acetyltransferase